MAWNEPGGNKPRDPWGGGGGGGDQRPPDLDEALKNLKDRINNLFGGKGGGNGGGNKPSGGFPGGLLVVALVVLVVGWYVRARRHFLAPIFVQCGLGENCSGPPQARTKRFLVFLFGKVVEDDFRWRFRVG